ncbi:hypothetical protein D1007_40651 [Hordeum vulgare]|nr:hypothetical protein D1007_40651 [Hordeum vulgare]
MAKADKCATADSTMLVKVTTSDKVVPTPTTPKPASDNRGGQNNHKRKADHLDSRSNNKLVANVEGEAPTTQAGSQWRRTGKNDWKPKLSFEQMLDAPCKMHSGVKPSTHTLRHTSTMSHVGYAGYSSCAGYIGSADSNCYAGYNCFASYDCSAGYNNKFGFAKPRILSSRHLVGGRHGGRRRAGCHNGIRGRESRACNCFIKRGATEARDTQVDT